jgi:hypothetical protein
MRSALVLGASALPRLLTCPGSGLHQSPPCHWQIPVIEMTVLTGVEFYAPVVVEAGGNLPICSEGLYDGKVAISDAQPPIGSSELYTRRR